MTIQTAKLSESELARMKELFATFDGEVIEVIDGKKVVVAFDSLKRMMVLVDGMKLRGRKFSVNSKKIDGRNVCTFFK
jgi:ATP-dependent RNA circularization protein (DNA/RNA ligase family)